MKLIIAIFKKLENLKVEQKLNVFGFNFGLILKGFEGLWNVEMEYTTNSILSGFF